MKEIKSLKQICLEFISPMDKIGVFAKQIKTTTPIPLELIQDLEKESGFDIAKEDYKNGVVPGKYFTGNCCWNF